LLKVHQSFSMSCLIEAMQQKSIEKCVNFCVLEMNSQYRPLTSQLQVLRISTDTGAISTVGSTAEGHFKWSRGLLAKKLRFAYDEPI